MTKPATDSARFRDFAKAIVNTPKAVVDERAKAYKEAREKAKKARP